MSIDQSRLEWLKWRVIIVILLDNCFLQSISKVHWEIRVNLRNQVNLFHLLDNFLTIRNTPTVRLVLWIERMDKIDRDLNLSLSISYLPFVLVQCRKYLTRKNQCNKPISIQDYDCMGSNQSRITDNLWKLSYKERKEKKPTNSWGISHRYCCCEFIFYSSLVKLICECSSRSRRIF